MTTMNRRTFCRFAATAAGAGVLARATPSAWTQPLGANDAVRVAVIGFNKKGVQLIRQLTEMSGVRIAALCDVDPKVLAREVEKLRAKRVEVFATTDARELMERDDIDAVVIATCNHWHALLTVWACQAGKDVYVEKPVSHSLWEGRKMVEAAEKHGRVVQAGSQLRSDTGIAEAVRYVKEGNLGKIQWIHGICYTRRDHIGRRQPWYPEGLDYDRWCGPAPMAPLERAELHYDWHWKWDTGNGDMANIGAHVVDIARRFLAPDAMPRRLLSLGGRYVHDDAAETPNAQFAVYDYPALPVFFETRGLPAKPGVSYMDQLRGIRTGVVVQCEGGSYAGYIGGTIFDAAGKLVKRIPGDGGAGHMANFIAAVRSRRVATLAASIQTGADSAALCHSANISYRVGEPAARRRVQEELEAFPMVAEAFERQAQHLSLHGVDLVGQPPIVGPWLSPASGEQPITVRGPRAEALTPQVEFLARGVQRPPYVIPEVL